MGSIRRETQIGACEKVKYATLAQDSASNRPLVGSAAYLGSITGLAFAVWRSSDGGNCNFGPYMPGEVIRGDPRVPGATGGLTGCLANDRSQDDVQVHPGPKQYRAHRVAVA